MTGLFRMYSAGSMETGPAQCAGRVGFCFGDSYTVRACASESTVVLSRNSGAGKSYQ